MALKNRNILETFMDITAYSQISSMEGLILRKVITVFGGTARIVGWLAQIFKKDPLQGLLSFKRMYFVCVRYLN